MEERSAAALRGVLRMPGKMLEFLGHNGLGPWPGDSKGGAYPSSMHSCIRSAKGGSVWCVDVGIDLVVVDVIGRANAFHAFVTNAVPIWLAKAKAPKLPGIVAPTKGEGWDR